MDIDTSTGNGQNLFLCWGRDSCWGWMNYGQFLPSWLPTWFRDWFSNFGAWYMSGGILICFFGLLMLFALYDMLRPISASRMHFLERRWRWKRDV